MSMTIPTLLTSISGIKTELTTACDGPVGPFTVISRSMELTKNFPDIDRDMLANACYESLLEMGCELDKANIIPSNEY